MSVTGGPVVWVKYKYLAPKSSGRYKGNSNGSSLKKREGQRKKSRKFDVTDMDEEMEIALLVEAIGTVDRLLQRLPQQKTPLEETRGKLRERLARIE